MPTLALALTSTLVTTYTPVVAREFVESSAVIGMIIGLEGLVALANALWELSLAALKTFVVLYVIEELGFSQSASSAIIGGVAVGVLFAGLYSGRLADRYGAARVLRIALPIHGLGFLVPLLTTDPLLVMLSVPFIALGAEGEGSGVWLARRRTTPPGSAWN